MRYSVNVHLMNDEIATGEIIDVVLETESLDINYSSCMPRCLCDHYLNAVRTTVLIGSCFMFFSCFMLFYAVLW